MNEEQIDQIYILCLGRSSQYAEGLIICCYSWRATAALGLLDSHLLQCGYKYSQTCIYKENIKICTVANFQCVLSCWKTPIKVCKNSFVKKIRKSLPWQQCIKSPSEISRCICLAQHLPQTDGEQNYESVCQVLSSFLWQVSGSSGMPVKLVTLYI